MIPETSSVRRVRFGEEEIIIIENSQYFCDELPTSSAIKISCIYYNIPRPKSSFQYKRLLSYYKNTATHYQPPKQKSTLSNLASILSTYLYCK
jgi:hypothetical protein